MNTAPSVFKTNQPSSHRKQDIDQEHFRSGNKSRAASAAFMVVICLIGAACILLPLMSRDAGTGGGFSFLAMENAYAQAGADAPVYYRTGDTLNVISDSGLTVRQAPDARAAKLAVVPYAGSVIAGDERNRAPFSVGGISGYWIPVASKGKSGYAFDGFLSILPAPKTCTNCEYEFGQVLEQYLDTNLKVTGAPSEKRKGMINHIEKRYSNGFVLKKNVADEGVPEFSMELDMPRVRTAEAFLLCRQMQVYLLKNVSFPEKSSQRNIDENTGEKITVTGRGGASESIKIERVDKVSGGGGTIEFIRRPTGTLMRYHSWGS